MSDLPTARQRQLLRIIHQAVTTAGGAPTIREMCTAMGTASTNGMVDHLDRLEAKGLIERSSAGEVRARALRLTDAGRSALGIRACTCSCHQPLPETPAP